VDRQARSAASLHLRGVVVAYSVLGIETSVEAPKDIHPYINIPVVTIVWSYTGLPPEEMEGRIVTVCERALTTTVNDIEHIQSESYEGVAVVRVFFQPSVKVELALSQITAVVQTILRVLPPGTFPPNISKYDASSVPILQLSLFGQGLTEEDLYDLGLSFIRPRLANVEGASIPLAGLCGGSRKPRLSATAVAG
jgi:multidrug efflux pump subunit AcrB